MATVVSGRMTTVQPVRRVLALALALALASVLAACSSAAAPTAPPSAPAVTSPPSRPPTSGPSTGPDEPVTQPPGSDPGSGGGGFTGSGDGGDLVIPHPGTIHPHPVAVESILTNVDGRHVTAKLTWTSGVEPCYVLDSVVVSRDGSAIDVTVVEGSSDPGAICIDIAKTKSTIVDLGELEPGTYRILSPGSDAPPVEITIA